MNHFTTHSRKDRKISPPIIIQYSPRPQNPQQIIAKKQHRNGSSLTRQTTLFSIFRSLFGPLSLGLGLALALPALSGQSKSCRLILYINGETIWRTLERNHVNNKKNITSYANRLSKFFEEARIARSLWNFTMSS